MRTQNDIIGHLLERKSGTTCMEMIVQNKVAQSRKKA